MWKMAYFTLKIFLRPLSSFLPFLSLSLPQLLSSYILPPEFFLAPPFPFLLYVIFFGVFSFKRRQRITFILKFYLLNFMYSKILKGEDLHPNRIFSFGFCGFYLGVHPPPLPLPKTWNAPLNYFFFFFFCKFSTFLSEITNRGNQAFYYTLNWLEISSL